MCPFARELVHREHKSDCANLAFSLQKKPRDSVKHQNQRSKSVRK